MGLIQRLSRTQTNFPAMAEKVIIGCPEMKSTAGTGYIALGRGMRDDSLCVCFDGISGRRVMNNVNL